MQINEKTNLICQNIEIWNKPFTGLNCMPVHHWIKDNKAEIFDFIADELKKELKKEGEDAEKIFRKLHVMAMVMAAVKPELSSCLEMDVFKFKKCVESIGKLPPSKAMTEKTINEIARKLKTHPAKLKAEFFPEKKKPKYAKDAILVKEAKLIPTMAPLLTTMVQAALLRLTYVNQTDFPITGVQVNVSIRDPFNREIFKKQYEDMMNIDPGYEVTNHGWTIRLSSAAHQRYSGEKDPLYQLAENGTARIKVDIMKVAFADGTILTNAPKQRK
jgi:hypothetical protein